jgi:hypothetical protein
LLNLLESNKTPIIHCDIDIIIEKDLEDLVKLDYDMIISKEIGGTNSFPKECSQILGFGVCTGFYIVKESSKKFMQNILEMMMSKKYSSCSDQVTLMNYISNSNYKIEEGDDTFIEKVIHIDNIKIGVLKFDIVIRDPIYSKEQYANHINVDNVGGSQNFIRYFYEKLETLPLTCRCGKTYLGDYSVCTHNR